MSFLCAGELKEAISQGGMVLLREMDGDEESNSGSYSQLLAEQWTRIIILQRRDSTKVNPFVMRLFGLRYKSPITGIKTGKRPGKSSVLR